VSGRDFRVCVMDGVHVYEDSIGAPAKCCGVLVAGVNFGGAATEDEVAETQARAARWARARGCCVACHRNLMHATFWAEAWNTYRDEGRCPRCGPALEAKCNPAAATTEAAPEPTSSLPQTTPTGDDR
jgi:hypothetical protein